MQKRITMVDAVESLAKDKYFYADSFGTITWIDSVGVTPTEEELTAEVTRLQAEYDNKEYQCQRAAAYPSIADQLDTIYHSGIDAWKLTITAVKEEFPK